MLLKSNKTIECEASAKRRRQCSIVYHVQDDKGELANPLGVSSDEPCLQAFDRHWPCWAVVHNTWLSSLGYDTVKASDNRLSFALIAMPKWNEHMH